MCVEWHETEGLAGSSMAPGDGHAFYEDALLEGNQRVAGFVVGSQFEMRFVPAGIHMPPV
ncbi:MAG: hypothetical protein U5P41_05380 [Gammaproteobacteria bacterium]|nr:hypothetical protein [Gammaproteobacteria bacterium]